MFEELYQFVSEILELSILMGQVHTCLANFLSDKDWYDCIILCHMSISELWFDMVWILSILRIWRISTIECFEHFENWLVALGALYWAILDLIRLSLVYVQNCLNECQKSADNRFHIENETVEAV